MKRKINQSDFNSIDIIFKEIVAKEEIKNKDRLAEENVPLPLASNFAFGDVLQGMPSASPSENIPDWTKELLNSSWNKAIVQYSDQINDEQNQKPSEE